MSKNYSQSATLSVGSSNAIDLPVETVFLNWHSFMEFILIEIGQKL